MKILFVCMGNLCRSPIAEAIARRRAAELNLPGEFVVASAGTYPPRIGAPADPRALKIGEQRGYDLTGHRTRRVAPADFDAFDAILAMDRDILATLESIAPPRFTARVELFLGAFGTVNTAEVPDPYYGSPAGFEHVFDLCESGLVGLQRVASEGLPWGSTAQGRQVD